MHELIYAGKEVEGIIKAKYPNAVIIDASDEIHTERFEFDADVTKEEFYIFAIKQGFVRTCFGFELMLRGNDKEQHEQLRKWLQQAVNEKCHEIKEEE